MTLSAKLLPLTALLLLVIVQTTHAQDTKRSSEIRVIFDDSTSWRTYTPIDGFFQLANSDLSNNRFILSGRGGNIMLGIGGRIALTSLFDFEGTIPDNSFTTSLIPVPTVYDNQFRIFANLSRINLKVVARINGRPLVSFIEGNFAGPDNSFRLRHAYISYYGFTVGQTWTTFMDLEAMPMTVDAEGPNNAIAARQPMIRYTYHRKGLELAVAAEMPVAQISDYTYTPIKIYPKAQRIPNFTAHVKYKSGFGHVQLAGVLKIMNYGDSTAQAPKNVYVTGGGVSLSGILHVGRRSNLYYQFSYGCGIANYIQDLNPFNYDLVPSIFLGEKMKPAAMWGGYLAFEHKWSEKFSSNAVFGLTSIRSPFADDMIPGSYIVTLYKTAEYLAINTFWDFIPNGTIGLEYLYGRRNNLNNEHGTANRINLMVSYMF